MLKLACNIPDESWKVLAAPSFSIFTITAPSNGTAVTFGMLSLVVGGRFFSKQWTRSNFVPCRSSPNWDNDGGCGWFSWRKTSFVFPPRTRQDTYNWANKVHIFFSDSICSFSYGAVFFWFLNSCNLFLVIGEKRDVVFFANRVSTKLLNCSWPSFSTLQVLSMTSGLAISPLCRTRRSVLSSVNEFFPFFPWYHTVHVPAVQICSEHSWTVQDVEYLCIWSCYSWCLSTFQTLRWS